MKEMHNDLILYEKQVKQILSENYQLKYNQSKIKFYILAILFFITFNQLHIFKYYFYICLSFLQNQQKPKNYQKQQQQNQIISERNGQQENEMKKMREQIIQQDNRIRLLENELHNYTFQQKLNIARPIQSSEKGFQNQFPSSQQNTPQGSFNNQISQYK